MDTFDYAEQSTITTSSNASNASPAINSVTKNSVTKNSSKRGPVARRVSKIHPVESAGVKKVLEESFMSDTSDHDISIYDFPSVSVYTLIIKLLIYMYMYAYFIIYIYLFVESCKK